MTPLTFEQIMEQPKLTEPEISQFLASQYFARNAEWQNKHRGLFKEMGLFDESK